MRTGIVATRLAVASLSAVGCFGLTPTASAEVQNVSTGGFTVRHTAEVPVGRDVAFEMLVQPARWWNPEHTYSGDAGNLSLDARTGGCFCEALPVDSSRKMPGGVEHMRVMHVDPGKTLRLSGALGPLQADAVVGTLTWTLKSLRGENRTRIEMVYVVGGHFQHYTNQLAPAVEMVLGEQVGLLAAKLGGGLMPVSPSTKDAAGGRKF